MSGDDPLSLFGIAPDAGAATTRQAHDRLSAEYSSDATMTARLCAADRTGAARPLGASVPLQLEPPSPDYLRSAFQSHLFRRRAHASAPASRAAAPDPPRHPRH
jgi:hypothetical protein